MSFDEERRYREARRQIILIGHLQANVGQNTAEIQRHEIVNSRRNQR